MKEKRKNYHQRKKLRVKDLWEDIALDSLKEQWKKQCSESHATHFAEIEETKKKS